MVAVILFTIRCERCLAQHVGRNRILVSLRSFCAYGYAHMDASHLDVWCSTQECMGGSDKISDFFHQSNEIFIGAECKCFIVYAAQKSH